MKISHLLLGLLVSLGLTPAFAQSAPTFSGVTLTPAAGIAFPLTYVGQSSAEQTVTLKNTYQGSDWAITQVTPSDKQYEVLAETCTTRPVVRNGGTCTVTMRFTPVTANLASSAKITLTRAGAGGNFWIPVTGKADAAPLVPTLPAATSFVGVTAAPATGLAFAELAPGQVSPTQRLTLANTFQGTDHVITAVTSTNSAFEVVAETCTKALVARKGGTCTVDVQFKPQAPGQVIGKLAFTRTSAGGNFFANLAGIGKGAATVTSYVGAQLSPTALAFGEIQRNTQSAEQTLTLTNTTQQATWTVNSILSNMTSYRVLGHTCATLAPGASCAIRVAFAPAYAQPLNGTLTIHRTFNGVTSALLVKLTGAGITTGQLQAQPGALTWSNVPVGDTDTSKSLTFTNTGATALTLGTPSLSTPDFQVTSTCAGPLAPGATCTLPVAFSPKALGSRTGILTLPHDGPSSPAVIQLSGAGSAQGILSATPASMRFDDTSLSEASAPQTVILQNVGTGPLSLTQWSLSDAQFTSTSSNCGTLAPSASCQVGLRFNPTTIGEQIGTLNIAHTGKTGKLAVALSGYGYAPSGVRATPNTVALGPVQLCDYQWCSNSSEPTAAPSLVTITNQSAVPLTDLYFDASHPNELAFDYNFSTCGDMLNAGQSCQIAIRFFPEVVGTRNFQVSAYWNEGTRPLVIPLTATVTGTRLDTNTTKLRFPYTNVGAYGTVKRITVTNTGNAIATGLFAQLIDEDNSFLIEATTCTTTLAAGQSCYYDVRFSPNSTDQHWNSLVIDADNSWRPFWSISLKGNIGAGGLVRINAQQTALRWTEPNFWGTQVEGVDISEGDLVYQNTSENDYYIYYDSSPVPVTRLSSGQSFTIPANRGIGLHSRVIILDSGENIYEIAQFISSRLSVAQNKAGASLLSGQLRMIDTGDIDTFMEENNQVQNISGTILELHNNATETSYGSCATRTALAPGESCSTGPQTDITVTPQGSTNPTLHSVRLRGFDIPM